MNKNNTHQPHDKLFRAIMSEPKVAQDFLKHHLPLELQEAIDFSSLMLKKDTFVDKDFVKKETDVLFSVNLHGKQAYLYLLCEQQTKPDKWMPFRLLIYLVRIMELAFKQSGGKTLPLVYPIVFYSGQSKWNYSTDIKDLINAPKALVEKVWMQAFRLEQASDIKADEIAQHPFSGTLSWVMAHIKVRNFMQRLEEEILPYLQQISQVHDIGFMNNIFWYIIRLSDTSASEYIEFVEKNFTPEVGLEMGLLAEQLKQEGRQEGRQESMDKVAQKLLIEGCDLEFVIKITGLPRKQVMKLKSQDK